METARSASLFERAKEVMVGGVSSPVRSFGSVGGVPRFIDRGEGARLWDLDGSRYTDYVLSWGPLIIGHAHPDVLKAIVSTAKRGTSFGAPTLPELELAEEIHRSMRGIEKLRFVNSGTEAAMSALRVARAHTRRRKVLKFEGCYHGHADPFLTAAGSGLATLEIPTSPGVPEGVTSDTVTVPFNDVEAVAKVVEAEGEGLAAVIVEPVAGNMGVVPPEEGFLRALRTLTSSCGAVLIFDEVITGFRVARGGAQELYDVAPDLTLLGKVIGGGLPVGAYGGSSELMSLVAPEGKVYQAGTLSGNPVAMAAGLATLRALDLRAYERLERTSSALEEALLQAASEAGVEVTVNRVGSMVGFYFGGSRVRSFGDARATASDRYPRFHQRMLKRGNYLPPSPFETIFLSTAHTEQDVGETGGAALAALKEEGD
ncbi:MAG: glutamate-1-semialdehyde 2,1-aminomutase [archaeon]|nr:MAG: glutamate-1-semialdehyde 2,1-aminomutase [archaeon]